MQTDETLFKGESSSSTEKEKTVKLKQMSEIKPEGGTESHEQDLNTST